MAEQRLDEREFMQARRTRARRLLQAVARVVLQIWQKKRFGAVRSGARGRSGSELAVVDMAALLGWDQTRAYEAERDLGDCLWLVDPGALRLWPRLRALDELAALELLEVELDGSADSGCPPLHVFWPALREHLATWSPTLLRQEILAELDLGADDELFLAVVAWISDQRKAADVRRVDRTRLSAVLPRAIRAFQRIAAREYAAIAVECAGQATSTEATAAGPGR